MSLSKKSFNFLEKVLTYEEKEHIETLKWVTELESQDKSELNMIGFKDFQENKNFAINMHNDLIFCYVLMFLF